jgi:hypothetical protein
MVVSGRDGRRAAGRRLGPESSPDTKAELETAARAAIATDTVTRNMPRNPTVSASNMSASATAHTCRAA